jgi:hypothetical protein
MTKIRAVQAGGAKGTCEVVERDLPEPLLRGSSPSVATTEHGGAT